MTPSGLNLRNSTASASTFVRTELICVYNCSTVAAEFASNRSDSLATKRAFFTVVCSNELLDSVVATNLSPCEARTAASDDTWSKRCFTSSIVAGSVATLALNSAGTADDVEIAVSIGKVEVVTLAVSAACFTTLKTIFVLPPSTTPELIVATSLAAS
ncbi:Uncharacterised protein [Streptococcus suis]|uniref:Uncharacterized protein n=1 Tax=Streptococcus suis TaxID=1307 RepID=A0A0Z8BGK3_STRSU|nr:Uncharacterised protein [Streptococcus suis]